MGPPAILQNKSRSGYGGCCVNYISDWPGNSPYLNPIENLRGVIKRGLRSRVITSLPKVDLAICDILKDFPATKLQNLADSLPKRLAKVLNQVLVLR